MPSLTQREQLFSLGKVVGTYAAIRLLLMNGIAPDTILARHAAGDWRDMTAEDRRSNYLAAQTGLRVLSSFDVTAGERVWVITEADRSATTLLLPSEY